MIWITVAELSTKKCNNNVNWTVTLFPVNSLKSKVHCSIRNVKDSLEDNFTVKHLIMIRKQLFLWCGLETTSEARLAGALGAPWVISTVCFVYS